MLSSFLIVLSATLRMATPVLLAATGGLITQQAGVFNVGLEGFMITGAFFAVAVSHTLGAPYLGVLAGALMSGLVAWIFGLVVVRGKADPIIAGVGMNLFAWGITAYLMKLWLGSTGSFSPPTLKGLPEIGGYTPLVYCSWVVLAAVSVWLYRTRTGLEIRTVGDNPGAAESAGINAARTKIMATVISGLLAGLAGAHLSLGYVTLFSENMTAGRGFLAFTAVIFGRGVPIYVAGACLLFGLAEALALQWQQANVPAQFVLMIPYVLTIVALAFTAILDRRRPGAHIR